MKKHCTAFSKALAVFLSILMLTVLIFSLFGIYFAVHFRLYTNTETQILHTFLEEEITKKCSVVYDKFTLEENPIEYFKNTNFSFEIIDESGKIICADYRNDTVIEKATFELNGLTIHGFMMTRGENIFNSAQKAAHFLYLARYAFIVFAVLSFLLLVADLYYLLSMVGYRIGSEMPVCSFVERIPFDFLCLISAGIITGVVFFLIHIFKVYTLPDMVNLVILWATAVGFYGILLFIFVSLAIRIKTGTFLKNNISYRFFGEIFRGTGKLVRAIPTVWKTVILFALYIVIELLLLIFFHADTLLWVIAGIKDLLFAALICFAFYHFKCLQKHAEYIAGGNTDISIDVSHMAGDFKKFGEALNSIESGMSHAISERTKSERMKAELITNVSHDIKTPLTSIISYVDLLKQEDIENDKIKDYIKVLDRQSGRLKKLIGDLVEASKASSGSIHVNKEDCDIGVLLQQSCGEYDEKFKKAGLEPVLHIPEEAVVITADGRLMWRVFDNLLSNICKYSLSGTRVYLDATRINDSCTVAFKNISCTELNIPADELTERFVRADSSRSTDGSGLGLSIATSLVELQGGTMKISTDGDLFKVTLSFPIQIKNPD